MQPRLFLLITTHTPLHLERVLFGVARSKRAPDSVTVSCDNDCPTLLRACRQYAAQLNVPATIIQRPHTGTCRLAQVINNGLRHLAALPGTQAIQCHDRVVVIQGDCCPGREFLSEHMRLGSAADLVIGFRHDLTQDQTEHFDDAALARGEDPARLTLQQVRALDTRHRRLEWQARLRPVGLAKRHKPKVLGANFSVRFGAFTAINGMDEEYTGYGSEDDDLGRRLYAHGASVAVGVRQLELYHLWHPTRKAKKWEQSSGVGRFRLETPTRAVHGLDNPLPQPQVTVHTVAQGVRC